MYFCRIDKIIALITNKLVREKIPTNNNSHKTFEFPLRTYFEEGQGRKLDHKSLDMFEVIRHNRRLKKHLFESSHITFSRSGAPDSIDYIKMTVLPATKLTGETKALMLQAARDIEISVPTPTPSNAHLQEHNSEIQTRSYSSAESAMIYPQQPQSSETLLLSGSHQLICPSAEADEAQQGTLGSRTASEDFFEMNSRSLRQLRHDVEPGLEAVVDHNVAVRHHFMWKDIALYVLLGAQDGHYRREDVMYKGKSLLRWTNRGGISAKQYAQTLTIQRLKAGYQDTAATKNEKRRYLRLLAGSMSLQEVNTDTYSQMMMQMTRRYLAMLGTKLFKKNCPECTANLGRSALKM
jgi:hypothetical protein